MSSWPSSSRFTDVPGALLQFDTDELTGSIEVGKLADYVILNRNLVEIPAEDIADTAVLLTMLAGDETYRSAQFSG